MTRRLRLLRFAAVAAGAGTLAVGTLTAACGGEGQSGDLLLHADRVFGGERVIEDGSVLIENGEIVAVGASADLEATASRTIELGAATILPGLIDLHAHAEYLAPELILASGVTTIRDLGASPASLTRRHAQPGRLRVFSAGPIITAAGGYPIPVHGAAIALPVSGEAEAAAAVERLAAQGASVIKIAVESGLPTLQHGEIRAIVSAAHMLDLRVTAHVGRFDDARTAFADGVDELAHLPCVGRDDGLMRELAVAKIEVVGTLHVQALSCPDSLAHARGFVAAGERLLYGSDMGNAGIPLGLNRDELRLLNAAGLSAVETLQAATSSAGRLIGEELLGRLVRGAPADLIVVTGNPLRDLNQLGDVSLVIAGGVIAVEKGRLVGAG